MAPQNSRPRSAFSTVASNVQDRNRGQGLPSTISDQGFQRMAAVVERRRARRTLVPTDEQTFAPAPPSDNRTVVGRRFAAVADVERSGFRRVAAGFYQASAPPAHGKSAHPIWELKAAEDGEGYVLLRQREERAVDLRQAGTGGPGGPGTAAAVASGIIRQAQARGGQPPQFKPGDMVKYTTKWLRSVGMYTNVPKKGKVLDLDNDLGWPNVDWGDGEPRVVHPGNLMLASKPDHDASLMTTAAAESYAINPERDQRRRAAPTNFLVSLLQTPGGDVQGRKTVFSNKPMDLDDLTRLVGELKPGPMVVTHDTWTDGEWELRVRGPRGQLIHEYESSGHDEIGGAKGRALIESLQAVLGDGGGEDLGGLPPEADAVLSGEEPLPEGEGVELPPGGGPGSAAPAGDAGGGAPPAPLAPSAAALRRGQKVLVIRQGQIADAVVLMVNPQQQAVEVLFGGGGQGSVPMGDVIDNGVEVELEGEGDFDALDGGDVGGGGAGDGFDFELESGADDFGDDGGGGEDGGESFVEITADDVPSSGGAGHDPFDVALSPESEETPSEFSPGDSSDEQEQGHAAAGGEDFEFAARRYLTARLHRHAVDFKGVFRPGARIEVIRPPDSGASHFGGVPLEVGQEFTVEGFHPPEHDEYLGYDGLADPVPGGDPYLNMRVRLRDDAGQEVLITADELEQNFDYARGGVPETRSHPGPQAPEPQEQLFGDGTDLNEDLDSAPMGEIDPAYADTVHAPRPPQGRPTMPARPAFRMRD